MGVIGRLWARLKQRGPGPLVMDAAASFAAGSPVPIATTRAALDAAWEHYRSRKADEALTLLAHELRSGNLTVDDLAKRHETAAMVFMLVRAAMEGAARINLRVLAKALRGYAVRGATAEEHYAHLVEIIKFMSRQELVVLAELHNVCRELGKPAWEDNAASVKIMDAVEGKLIPQWVESSAELRAIMGALARTGFVAPLSTLDFVAYATTPLADRAIDLAPIKEALAEEEGEPFFAR